MTIATIAVGRLQQLRSTPALFRFLREQPVAGAGLIVIVAMALVATFANLLAPFDPLDVDYAAVLAAPSREHWLGTDTFGRDMLARLMFGARTALVVGLVSSFVGCSIGALIGTASAYAGGRVDAAVQRVVEVMQIIPVIVTALVAVSVLGRNRVGAIDFNLILAIAIPMMPSVARVVRSAALGVCEMPYIDAARAAGYGHWRILLRHMAPNLVAPYLVMLTAFVGQAILLEASLAFIGLGVAEPHPDWGLMLSGNASDFYQEAPWVVLAPGLAITLTVFAFNLFGDGLRDFLDPKFKA
jgi:peptide/nickel transport system permease protein